MTELHWSDPEFLEWEEKQLEDLDTVEYHHSFFGERVRHFHCRRGPDNRHTQGSNHAGLMFSIKVDGPRGNVFKPLFEVSFEGVSEEELKDAQW